jgi:Tfp pilus assembly pilus retraction ATPase PilT
MLTTVREHSSPPPAALPPTTTADIDRIVDIYAYLDVPSGSRSRAGGAGAYCFYGKPSLASLGGTQLEEWIDRLLAKVHDEVPRGQEDFRIEIDGFAYRGLIDEGDQGTEISLRRLPQAPPTLKDLGLRQGAIRTLLEAEWLNQGGLLLFAGLTGQGKTTVASACVRSRLEAYAGRCVTVEDVIEVPLEGIWGDGACRQLKVDYATTDPRRYGFQGAIRRAYRCMPATRPAILYVGEVRDTETATEVVKAAANGMLVLSTIHAGDPIQAVSRLLPMAAEALGPEASAMMVSQALRMVMHISLDLDPAKAGWGRGAFSGSCAVSTGGTSALGSLIRQQKFQMIAQVVETQTRIITAAGFQCPPAHQLLTQLCPSGPS